MKSIKSLVALVLAASFSSGLFAASEDAPTLIKVPKTEAAMQATRATTAKDAANDSVKPATHQTKTKHVKAKSAKPTKKHNAKAPSAHAHAHVKK